MSCDTTHFSIIIDSYYSLYIYYDVITVTGYESRDSLHNDNNNLLCCVINFILNYF